MKDDVFKIDESLIYKWINIHTYLPPPNAYVLCYCPNFKEPLDLMLLRRVEDVNTTGNFWFDIDGHGYDKHFVSHWQTLPETPTDEPSEDLRWIHLLQDMIEENPGLPVLRCVEHNFSRFSDFTGFPYIRIFKVAIEDVLDEVNADYSDGNHFIYKRYCHMNTLRDNLLEWYKLNGEEHSKEEIDAKINALPWKRVIMVSYELVSRLPIPGASN